MEEYHTWDVQFNDEFLEEFLQYPEVVRDAILTRAKLLSARGPALSRPYADTLKGARVSNLKELRLDVDGGAWRVAYAFDPNRQALLLVAGDKKGKDQKKFYRSLIKTAEERFERHLAGLRD